MLEVSAFQGRRLEMDLQPGSKGATTVTTTWNCP